MVTNESDIAQSGPQVSSNSDQAEQPCPETNTLHIQNPPGDCELSAPVECVYNTMPSLSQGEENLGIEPSGHELSQALTSSCPANQIEDVVITAIRATDVALGLRRLPIGFFILLRHHDLEWKTETKPSSVNEDVVEWHGPIPISSDMSASICIEVYASFEFQPMLGSGELLRKMTVVVKDLLERSENNSPYKFFPKAGDVVSPCTSIAITVKRHEPENTSPSTLKVLDPHWSTPESRSELEDATNQGHNALLRYRRSGERQDLQRSIREFERALNTCPWDHPCRAVTQCNLAMAELIWFQVEGGDDRVEVTLQRYRDALASQPLGHPDRPCTLLHMAMVHLARRRNQTDDEGDQQAEELLNEVLGDDTGESHAKHAATALQKLFMRRNMDAMGPHQRLGTLASRGEASGSMDDDPWVLHLQLLERFERFGNLADLEQATSILRRLVESTSVWDSRYPAVLQNLGLALQMRFRRLGKMADLEDGISMLRDGVDLTSLGHPDKPGRLNNLGISLKIRFERVGELRDLEDAISVLRDAVDLTPVGHPDKPGRLSNLGTSFLTRFQCVGELSDLEGTISALRDAVGLTPLGHPDKLGCLNNLSTSLLTRFWRMGELSDLEDAISALRDAVDLTPLDHPDKLGILSNLGISLRARFERVGELSDLEDAISTLRDTVDLTPRGHPDKPRRLNNLGISLRTRFERVGELSDLEDAISALRDAIDITPLGHPDKPGHLSNLGISLGIHFKHIGELSDLEDAISVLRDAVDLIPLGHPDKPTCLNNLGTSLAIRFERIGELSDLEDAISALRDAVDLTPLGHPDKLERLNNLGISLTTRFQRIGELSDLEGAISALRDAVNLTPLGHPNKPGYLNSIGTSLLTRFNRIGELGDLKDAISALKDAVDLTPLGHPDKLGYLNSLGISLRARFERIGELSDLEDAILVLKDTVDLTPLGHPDKPRHLSSLGNSLRTRFERVDELSDLEDAVSALRDAVELTPLGHPDKSRYLNSLGASFLARFRRIGELSDLEDTILAFRDALDLTPLNHPNKFTCLNNLGTSLGIHFKRVGKPNDLEDAISALRDAVDLTPLGHPEKPACFNNLGSFLITRFERIGELSDLEDAISALKDAVDLTPLGHPDKSRRLNNLGNSLRIRFEHVGELSDLEDAILALRDAVDFTPLGHPDRPTCLNNLGTSLLTRFEHISELRDIEGAISVFSHSALSPLAPPIPRFDASRQWISCARHIRHSSLLHAYSIALHLIPEVAWIGSSLGHRYRQLTLAADTVREAAAAALDAGFPQAAVEWLEQGRSIVWGELLQLRSSYDELSSAHPELAIRLRKLSAELDQASANREVSSQLTATGSSQTIKLPSQMADMQRRLAIERDKLLVEIRQLPGFEQFLRYKRFSELRASAHSGPVVILNTAESRCDALVVLADLDHVIHVPLIHFTYKQLSVLQTTMREYVREARIGKTVNLNRSQPQFTWELMLSFLWTNVVQPVLDALAFSEPTELSRIFWCPTGPFAFLPIHAAGLYGIKHLQPGSKLLDSHISSYIPALSVLAPLSNQHTAPIERLRLLAVRQPQSDGLRPLPGVEPELRHIETVIEKSPGARAIFVESLEGTVEEVLCLMKDADWVHFACHGGQDHKNIINSGLCLANERCLALRDIIGLRRPRGGLAFLSACETAKGDERLSDEAAHIAAGMLFAGYGGVVGTMWVISDQLAPDVAKDVYEYLFRDGRRPDYVEAARALHEAIGRARHAGASFNEWVPFIHLGL